MPNLSRIPITPRRILTAVALLLLAGVAAFEIGRAGDAFMRPPKTDAGPFVISPSNAVSDSPDLNLSFLDPPTTAPALQFVDGDGRSMTLADFRGRVIVLNVWATWCVGAERRCRLSTVFRPSSADRISR